MMNSFLKRFMCRLQTFSVLFPALISVFISASACVSAEAETVKKALPPSDSAPEDWTRIPFYESRPEFVSTDAEVKRGFAVFSRPLVDAIYPESRPGAEERVEKLSFFAAGDQFQTLNFAVYPLQDLPGLRVVAGDFCTEGGNVFPAENIQIRLVTYRGIRYPQYNSKTKQYRVLPEYLQEVTETDAPKGEPQRYFLTFRVPAGMKAGTYSGEIRISYKDQSLSEAAVLPVSLRVLGFDLQKDPQKNYSAYYYPPKNADGTWSRDAMEREFSAMKDYGFTRSPVYSLSYNADAKKLTFPDIEFWTDLMKRNGLSGPIPVVGGGGTWLAERYYGAKFASHVRVLTPPREEFFEELARQCRELKKDVDANADKYPAMVFGPLDEISSESTDFGVRVYRAFHDAGLVTYTTKEPHDPSYSAYDDVVDIYASQELLPLYDEVMTQHKREYWCYPNHNSYERKDMVIMCKGGRMTYGFGFWRSGFNLMVPWIWRANSPNHFDEKTSSGGNILNPDTNEVIMTSYWECFREGISDLRYLYALEKAILEREAVNQNAEAVNSSAESRKAPSPELQKLTQEGRALLQEIWDSIYVQDKYLNRNLWESAKFDEYRTRMADLIEALYKYPALRDIPEDAEGNAAVPSVIIEPRVVKRTDPLAEAFERHSKDGTLKKALILPENCVASEKEAKVETVDAPAGAQNAKCALLTVTIDKQHDGSSANGPYPSNWPALAGYVADAQKLERIPHMLLMRVYITSNRTGNAANAQDGTADGTESGAVSEKTSKKASEKASETVLKTPIHVGIQPGGYSFNAEPNLAENEWHTILVPLENAGYEGLQPETKAPSAVRITISESNHEDGDVLKLYFDEISFVDFSDDMKK